MVDSQSTLIFLSCSFFDVSSCCVLESFLERHQKPKANGSSTRQELKKVSATVRHGPTTVRILPSLLWASLAPIHTYILGAAREETVKNYPGSEGSELADSITYLGKTSIQPRESHLCPRRDPFWSAFVCRCFRSSRRFHGGVRATDRLRQRSGGPAGTGPGSLLHPRRSDLPRRSAHQQLQVQRRGHPADVAVAARSLALRKQPGKTMPELQLCLLRFAALSPPLRCRRWTQKPAEAPPSPTSPTNWSLATTLLPYRALITRGSPTGRTGRRGLSVFLSRRRMVNSIQLYF